MQAVGHARRLEGREADGGIDGLLEDLVRHLGGDLLDLHAALLRPHHDDARRLAVEHEGEIVLLLDVRAGLDEQAVHDLAGRARLFRDERLAEELLGKCPRLLRRMRDFDAARLAAAARVDLRLDDDDRRRELLRVLDGLLGAERRIALRDVDAVGFEDGLALVLMNIHFLAPLL